MVSHNLSYATIAWECPRLNASFCINEVELSKDQQLLVEAHGLDIGYCKGNPQNLCGNLVLGRWRGQAGGATAYS